VQNIYYTCRQAYGRQFNYRELMKRVAADGEIVMAKAYAIDRGDEKQQKFQSALTHMGFTVRLKPYIQRSDGSAKGDWDVTTSVTPPQGFTVDQKSLSVKVKDEMKIVLFTVTEGGESWKETKVKYKIKHNKKTKTLENKIGIKLSKQLAKKKNKGIYGDTDNPGPFKGGKKVEQKEEKQDKKKK